ncbi:hypothetical protein BDN70DRAFT_908514 [Pholiota conissans]|uniref:Uncharacterized protein n=1 Tax=Pholiota conissans TaxID=109636 RepID=A0A9P5YV31_9AGAR|nr:hypothetical protein BDN70DRAFT_908514 [Pholiota conissans]
MDSVAPLLQVPLKFCDHRRGQYPAISCGISHGGGQAQPSNLSWKPPTAAILSQLTQEEAFYRISGFTDCLFETYAPRLHRYYGDVLDDVTCTYPHLKRPFDNSVFAACCFNFGPRTVTYPRRDHANLAWGWCSITALGSFDADKGGHLILWDLNLVIRFPPGSTILIPSAILEHSNVSIAQGEKRYSFVQFSAGGLFRWVENDFKTEKKWVAQATPEELAQRRAEVLSRWMKGLDMLSHIDEFGPDA